MGMRGRRGSTPLLTQMPMAKEATCDIMTVDHRELCYIPGADGYKLQIFEICQVPGYNIRCGPKKETSWSTFSGAHTRLQVKLRKVPYANKAFNSTRFEVVRGMVDQHMLFPSILIRCFEGARCLQSLFFLFPLSLMLHFLSFHLRFLFHQSRRW